MAFHTSIDTAVAWRLAVTAQFPHSTLATRRAGVLAGPFPRTPAGLMVCVCGHRVRHGLHFTPCCDFGRIGKGGGNWNRSFNNKPDQERERGYHIIFIGCSGVCRV
jgi:hypothetical protein